MQNVERKSFTVSSSPNSARLMHWKWNSSCPNLNSGIRARMGYMRSLARRQTSLEFRNKNRSVYMYMRGICAEYISASKNSPDSAKSWWRERWFVARMFLRNCYCESRQTASAIPHTGVAIHRCTTALIFKTIRNFDELVFNSLSVKISREAVARLATFSIKYFGN